MIGSHLALCIHFISADHGIGTNEDIGMNNDFATNNSGLIDIGCSIDDWEVARWVFTNNKRSYWDWVMD
ncbi:hypothetical protein, partial [Shewanella sp. AC91-MNA-CIBAN-0169]|uniref:hypothetical protein n=1 Tax=Shewanella sp. AC91-MNA-CIBAN-0169 TaxID=3140466 RepID=UPI00331DC69C